MDFERINVIYDQLEGIKYPYFKSIILLVLTGLQVYVADHLSYLGWSSLMEDCCNFNYLFNNNILDNLSKQLWKLLTIREKIKIMFYPIIYAYPWYEDDFVELEGSPIINACLNIFKESTIDITTVSNVLFKIARMHTMSIDSLGQSKILQITYPSRIDVSGLDINVLNEQIGYVSSFSLFEPTEITDRLIYLFDAVHSHIGFDNILKIKIDEFIRSELDIYGVKFNNLAIRFLE